MEMHDIRPKLKDIEGELSRMLEKVVDGVSPKNQNSSFYKEAILSNLNRAQREVFMAIENTRFYTNADEKPVVPMSEK